MVSLLCPLLDHWALLCTFASISTFGANPDLLLNRLKLAPEADYSISPEQLEFSLAKICIQIKNVAVIIASGCGVSDLLLISFTVMGLLESVRLLILLLSDLLMVA